MIERKLTAKEARELADESEDTLECIYDIIRQEAERGRVYVEYKLESISNKVFNNIVESLKNDGFEILYDTKNLILCIHW